MPKEEKEIDLQADSGSSTNISFDNCDLPELLKKSGSTDMFGSSDENSSLSVSRHIREY